MFIVGMTFGVVRQRITRVSHVRRCNDLDPNLLKSPHSLDRPFLCPSWDERGCHCEPMVPCDCGLSFDDVIRLVVWPHNLF